MNQITTYLNAVATHIKAGKTLRQALEELKPVYNKSSYDEQQGIKLQVAQLIGKEYGVKPVMTNRGGVSFDRATKKGDAARKLLTYYFPTTLKTKPKPKVSKQVDISETKSKVIKSWIANGMTKAQILRAVEIAVAKK
jgi:hypothetical protein